MENFEFEIAEKFINETRNPVFLTGKAGTGKTTFLRQVIRNTAKNCIVVAPTGVAAINAGGVTIHSMFGLPTRAFVPANEYVDPNLANNIPMLRTHFHFRGEKQELFRELDLLVIDEVSMVRCDLLDAIDHALRFVRRSTAPFGGVQVLLIGDMYQLPPVVRDHEWPLLSAHYKSPYFFDSQVFRSLDPVYIELKKIYRQSDRNFIRILNNIRNHDLQEDDYEDLKKLYQPGFSPEEPGYITLTTHNKKADSINEKELEKIEAREQHLAAKVEGDFFENMFPTEEVLRLKIGAQIMFVKNDTSGEKKYFNGKIGIVEDIDYEEGLTVRFPDSGEKITVQKETWENIRYSVNEESQKIEQNSVGSFSQYPVRLAWAITIHKSQGLTFDKAVIDAGESFAPGQVYVALSRCTSMDNMILHSLITNRNIFSDPVIVDFSSRMMGEMQLENRLDQAQREFAYHQLLSLFSFEKLLIQIENWERKISKTKKLNPLEIRKLSRDLQGHLQALQSVSLKFHQQLMQLLENIPENPSQAGQLKERVTKAVDYFTDHLYIQIIDPLTRFSDEIRYKSGMKKVYTETDALARLFRWKTEAWLQVSLMGEKLYQGEKKEREVPEISETKGGGKKKSKASNSTFSDTLELYRSGLSISEIATKRSLTAGTIESHLAHWIEAGEIEISELIPTEKLNRIEQEIDAGSGRTAGQLKAALGEDFTFGEIRWVFASRKIKSKVS